MCNRVSKYTHTQTHGLALGTMAWLEAGKEGGTESPRRRQTDGNHLPVCSPSRDQARTLEECPVRFSLAIWSPGLMISFSRVTSVTSCPSIFPLPILNCFFYLIPEKKIKQKQKPKQTYKTIVNYQCFKTQASCSTLQLHKHTCVD